MLLLNVIKLKHIFLSFLVVGELVGSRFFSELQRQQQTTGDVRTGRLARTPPVPTAATFALAAAADSLLLRFAASASFYVAAAACCCCCRFAAVLLHAAATTASASAFAAGAGDGDAAATALLRLLCCRCDLLLLRFLPLLLLLLLLCCSAAGGCRCGRKKKRLRAPIKHNPGDIAKNIPEGRDFVIYIRKKKECEFPGVDLAVASMPSCVGPTNLRGCG